MQESNAYLADLWHQIQAYGGYFNAHLHLDRAGTFRQTVEILSSKGEVDGATLSLAGKHAIIPLIHASDCYSNHNLVERVEVFVRDMIRLGTSRADTVVDTTADCVGRRVIDSFLDIKNRYADRIDLRIGAYSPLGFRDDQPEHWDLIASAAADADFIGLLPERDDQADYPEHIGFEQSCRRMLRLAQSLDKTIHIHVDQGNHQYENASETVARIVDELEMGTSCHEEPFIWLIHVISPSTYEEHRFQRLAANLSRLNIGIIVCPSAAISMRQYRPLLSPTYNSIARVLDFVSAGVYVRIGSDNVCDITSPMGTVDLMYELKILGDAMRYYELDFWAKIAAGVRVDPEGICRLKQHLSRDSEFVEEVVSLGSVAKRPT